MAELRILPPAAKYFKKLKDKQLKRLFQEAIDEILEDPSVGEEKKGDLKGIKGYDIFYNHTNYELAYTVEYVKRNNSDAVLYFTASAQIIGRRCFMCKKM